MKRKVSSKSVTGRESLVIRPGKDAPLSRTQVEFNRLMKNLEAAKLRHAGEQERLDEVLAIAIGELMPLVEDLRRLNRDLVFMGLKASKTLRLKPQRRHWLGDFLSGKAGDLLADPAGLSAEDIGLLEAVIEELSPCEESQRMEPGEVGPLANLRKMMEQVAREAGLELDLSDLDTIGSREEFERAANERLRAAFGTVDRTGDASATPPRRKPSKAQAAKQRAQLALEEARNRDLKSLFKQLAKALHPDLEQDLLLKEHKKVWMQRLNTAYAAGDLREMLQLEMEWLGEEASNLSSAGDDKLKVYCMVLKEQIADLKRQTHLLPDEPQYWPLSRFRHPYYGTIANPVSIKRELLEEMRQLREMLEILAANDAGSRRLIYQWADAHCHSQYDPQYL